MAFWLPRNCPCFCGVYNMPTRKINSDFNCFKQERPCVDLEHDPPNMRVFEPGEWEHKCPSCGNIQIFTVADHGALSC